MEKKEEKLLRLRDVKEFIPMSTASVYKKMKELKFPSVHKFGGTAFWKLSEIQEYIDKGEEVFHKKQLSMQVGLATHCKRA